MKALSALLLAGLVVMALLYTNAFISAHLDTDRENAREVKKLKSACGRPKFRRLGERV